MKIHSSLALEALGLFQTYIHQYLKKKDMDIPLSIEPVINEWMDDIDGNISTFLRNDIELLFSKVRVNNWLLFHLIQVHNLETTEELLNLLKKMPPEEFRSLYMKMIKLEDEAPEKITPKKIKESIEKHFFSDAKGEDRNIYQLLKEPEEWKDRITSVYDRFYREFFIPRQELIEEQLSRRIENSQKKLSSDPDMYLDTLSVGHYKTVLNAAKNLRVYASFCYDRGFTISIKESIFWYGLRREMLLEEIDRKSKTTLLFSTLSDPKRIEILRLNTQKSWYSNELAKHFGITSATMSYHINKLLSAGMLTFEVGEQNKIYYQVNKKILCDLLDSAKEDLLGIDE